MQLKAYAKFQGKPVTWDKKDMVFVSLGYAYDKDLTEHVVLARSKVGERLMLAAFVCLTILIGLILMWLTIAYYETFWEKLGDQKHDANKTVQKSLYQATVLVFCCANIFNSGVFVIACLFKRPDFDATDEVVLTAFTLKMVTIPVLNISHLLVTIFAVFGNRSPENSAASELPAASQPSALIPKVLQVLALLNILIFIQTIAAAFIPLFAYLLLYTYHVLSALIFMASGTFCLIVFVANLLHRSGEKTCRYMLVLFLQACILLVFLAFICVLVMFYLLLLSHGLHTGGLQGFILSLVPSAVISAAGWYVKAYVLNREEPKQKEKGERTDETEKTEKTERKERKESDETEKTENTAPERKESNETEKTENTAPERKESDETEKTEKTAPERKESR